MAGGEISVFMATFSTLVPTEERDLLKTRPLSESLPCLKQEEVFPEARNVAFLFLPSQDNQEKTNTTPHEKNKALPLKLKQLWLDPPTQWPHSAQSVIPE